MGVTKHAISAPDISRNMDAQCLGQQPTFAAGDVKHHYFERAIIIFSTYCPTTSLTCLTSFPTACVDGGVHRVYTDCKLYTCLFGHLLLFDLQDSLYNCLFPSFKHFSADLTNQRDEFPSSQNKGLGDLTRSLGQMCQDAPGGQKKGKLFSLGFRREDQIKPC